jgi:deoxyribonuclease V
MNNLLNNSWLFPEDFKRAHVAQKEMAQQVLLKDMQIKPIKYVAGVDISNNPFDPESMIFAAIVVLSYPALEIMETVTHSAQQKFPYIPGLLGFREVPALVQAYEKLSIRPDVIMVDGHGVSHPRGLGIASHLGVLLDKPTLGVAKSILVGKPALPLAEEPGSKTSLIFKEKEIAIMLRSKKRCSPLIISAGHLLTLTNAVSLVGNCLKGYRLPEPTRQAHLMANMCRKSFLAVPHE